MFFFVVVVAVAVCIRKPRWSYQILEKYCGCKRCIVIVYILASIELQIGTGMDVAFK